MAMDDGLFLDWPEEARPFVEMLSQGATQKDLTAALEQAGYVIPVSASALWYRRLQAQAMEQQWVCQECGCAGCLFKTKLLCVRCSLKHRLVRQQQKGIVCLACGRSDRLIHARGLCNACYKVWRLVGDCSLLSVRKNWPKKFVCKTCGHADRRPGARGECQICYERERWAQGKKGCRMVQCTKCGQVRKYQARGLCRSCYSSWRYQSQERPHVQCAQCGQSKPHYSRGLCNTCYRKWGYYHRKAQTA